MLWNFEKLSSLQNIGWSDGIFQSKALLLLFIFSLAFILLAIQGYPTFKPYYICTTLQMIVKVAKKPFSPRKELNQWWLSVLFSNVSKMQMYYHNQPSRQYFGNFSKFGPNLCMLIFSNCRITLHKSLQLEITFHNFWCKQRLCFLQSDWFTERITIVKSADFSAL